jgi:hypothetical protein
MTDTTDTIIETADAMADRLLAAVDEIEYLAETLGVDFDEFHWDAVVQACQDIRATVNEIDFSDYDDYDDDQPA